MRWLALLIFSPAVWAINLWVPSHPEVPLISAERSQRLANAISQRLGLPIFPNVYDRSVWNDLPSASGLALVDGWRYQEFIQAGWTPLARLPRSANVNLYRRAGQSDAILDVGTPGEERIEHVLAPALAPNAQRLVTFGSAAGCLRQLFVGIDACLVSALDVRDYVERFQVDLEAVNSRGFRLPGGVLMQKGMSLDGSLMTGLLSQDQRLVKWNDFDDRFYLRLLRAVERIKDQAPDRPIVAESAYTFGLEGDSNDPIRVD